MHHVLLICLIALCACQGEERPLQPGPDASVLVDHTTFADFALEREVRRVLGRARGPLAEEELQSLGVLDLSPYVLGSLDGIERLKNLHSLRLNDSELTSAALAPLAMLSQLDTLDLSKNQIADLGALAALRTLRLLVLAQNDVSDLTPLAALTQLQVLDFGDNRVADLAPLRSLRRLRQLNFDNNLIRDIAPLTALPLLQHVELSGNPLDRNTLGELRRRGVLVTYYTQALTIGSEQVEASIRQELDKPLGPLDADDFLRVRQLSIAGAVESLAGIEHLLNLETLAIRGSRRALLNDLNPLAELVKLRAISIISTPILDLRALRDLRSLAELRVSIGKLRNLNGLGNHLELRELVLTGNEIREIHELRRLLRLRKLDLNSNQIRDIATLATLRGITDLSIASNQIEDITPLARMVSLQNVRMAANDITDIAPLLELENLQLVSLGSNPLNAASLGEYIPALRARGVAVLGVR